MTHLDWTLYFRTLVANHKFLTPSEKTKHFFMGEYDEFFAQFRSRVVFPAFIMESSQLDVEILAQQNLIRRTLSFMVVDKFTRDDYAEIQTRLSQCERTGLDIVGRLQDDIRYSTMCQVRLTDVHAEPCINEPQHYLGWRFELVVNDPVCLFDKNNWRDFESGSLLQECGHGLFTEGKEALHL